MANYGLAHKKKGCVNLSLRDSGTKSRKLLRVLAALALALSLLTVTGLVAFAEGDTDISTPAEDVSAEISAPESEEEVSAPTTEENGSSTEVKDFKNYPNLDPNAPLGEKFMYGLQVAGIGMAVVFLVLIVLMLILYVFKLFATAGAKKPAEASKAAPAAPVAPAAPAADDEQTIVAVATAAIAAERGESQCAFKVISITKLQ